MKGKIFLKIVGIILAVVVLFFAVTSLITTVGKNSNMKKIESFEQVKIENQLVPYKDENGYTRYGVIPRNNFATQAKATWDLYDGKNVTSDPRYR